MGIDAILVVNDENKKNDILGVPHSPYHGRVHLCV